MNDRPLVLSLFPGLSQAHLLGSSDAPVNHRVVVGTQDPNIIALSVRRSNGDTVAGSPVVDINDALLAAHLTTTGDIRTAFEEPSNRGRPAAVIDDFHPLAVVRIPLMECMATSSLSLLQAWLRTVFSTPVVAVSAREWLLTDTAVPLSVRRRAAMQSKVPHAAQVPHLARRAAIPLVPPPGVEGPPTVVTWECGVSQLVLPLSGPRPDSMLHLGDAEASTMAPNECVPFASSHLRLLYRLPAPACALRRKVIVHRYIPFEGLLQ